MTSTGDDWLEAAMSDLRLVSPAAELLLGNGTVGDFLYSADSVRYSHKSLAVQPWGLRPVIEGRR